MNKNTLVGIALLSILLLSTFAYSFISFSRERVEVPTGNIVKYRIQQDQEERLVQEGKTVVTFTYTRECNDCKKLINFLEQVANSYRDQIFLVEVEGNSTSIFIKSRNGQRIIGSITEERITKLLCDLMVQPPSSCVLGRL
jgi:thiol-disulfide isomerase/thioredoxin